MSVIFYVIKCTFDVNINVGLKYYMRGFNGE